MKKLLGYLILFLIFGGIFGAICYKYGFTDMLFILLSTALISSGLYLAARLTA